MAAATIPTAAYGAQSKTSPIAPLTIPRRQPGPNDVYIDIYFCGVCHSDIHQARDEWGGAIFPMVPGHEIIGKVAKIGSRVTKFKLGETVGVTCFVDSCRECEPCKAGETNYCRETPIFTYNHRERGTGNPTYGGYSRNITVDQDYVVRVPDSLNMAAAAPLLCAGVTTFSPLRHWKIKAGDQIAIVGLGGLGHMGVKIAKAMGAHVTVVSSSDSKRADAIRLGADDFVATSKPDAFKDNFGRFDFILDTVSADHDMNSYMSMLKRDATLCLVGAPSPPSVNAFTLIDRRLRLAGSSIGSVVECQEMMDFCAAHNIVSDIEIIDAKDINKAYERMIKNDVRYRFVIDVRNTLKVPSRL